MYYIPFMKWQQMRLSDICKESAERPTDGARYILKSMGWTPKEIWCC